MFYLIGEFVSSIFWGILIAVVMTIVLFCLPKLICSNYSYSIWGIVLLIVALLFVSFQSALLVGGMKVKKHIPSIEQISGLLPASSTDIQEISGYIIREYPVLNHYIKDVNDQINAKYTSLSEVNEIARLYYNNIQSFINKYIWRRVMWILGSVLLIGGYLFNSAYKYNKRGINSYDFDLYD